MPNTDTDYKLNPEEGGPWGPEPADGQDLWGDDDAPACDGDGVIYWNPSIDGNPEMAMDADCPGCTACEG